MNHCEECKVCEKFDQLLAAFPDGDIEGHRAYHESLILRNKDIGDFFKKLTFELAKWGILGLASFLAYAAWVRFLQGPMK